MGFQEHALRGDIDATVILPVCAGLKANDVHAAPRTKGADAETTRARDG
jgi:hypothetical protein